MENIYICKLGNTYLTLYTILLSCVFKMCLNIFFRNLMEWGVDINRFISGRSISKKLKQNI